MSAQTSLSCQASLPAWDKGGRNLMEKLCRDYVTKTESTWQSVGSYADHCKFLIQSFLLEALHKENSTASKYYLYLLNQILNASNKVNKPWESASVRNAYEALRTNVPHLDASFFSLGDLVDGRAQLMEVIRAKDQEIAGLQGGWAQAEFKILRLEPENAQLKARIADLESLRDATRKQRDEADETNRQLLNKLKESEEHRYDLSQQLVEQGRELQGAVDLAKSLQEELDKARDVLGGWEMQHEQIIMERNRREQQLDDSVKALEKTNQDLKQQLEGARKELEDSRQHSQGLQKQLDDSVKALEKTNQDLKQQLDDSVKALEESRQRSQGLQKQLDGVRKELEDANKHPQDLQMQLDDARKELQNSTQQLDSSRNLSKRLQQHLDNAKKDLENWKQLSQCLQQQLVDTRKELEDSKQLSQGLQQQLVDTRKELENSKHKLEDALKELKTKQDYVSALENDLKQQRPQDDVQEELKECKQKVEELEASLKAAEQKSTETNIKMGKLEALYQSVKEQLNGSQKDVQMLQASLQTSHQECSDAKDSCKNLEKDNASMKMDMEKVQGLYESSMARVQELEKEKKDLQDQCHSHQQMSNHSQNAYQALQQHAKDLQAEFDQKVKEFMASDQKLQAECGEQVQDEEPDEVEQLKAELDVMARAVAEKDAQLNKAHQAYDQLATDLLESNTELAKVIAELEVSQKESMHVENALKQKVQDLEAAIQTREASRLDSVKEMDKKIEQINSLKEQLNSATDEAELLRRQLKAAVEVNTEPSEQDADKQEAVAKWFRQERVSVDKFMTIVRNLKGSNIDAKMKPLLYRLLFCFICVAHGGKHEFTKKVQEELKELLGLEFPVPNGL